MQAYTLEGIGDTTGCSPLRDINSEHSLRDLNTLLNGSLIKWDGDYYTTQGRALYSIPLGVEIIDINTDADARYLPLNEVDTTPQEVGYYNLLIEGAPRVSVYFDRSVTHRRCRIGTHCNNTNFSFPALDRGSTLGVELSRHLGRRNTSYGSMLHYLVASSKRRYPKFLPSIDSIKRGEALSIAISKNVALAVSPYSEEIEVYLNKNKVATVGSDNSISMLCYWAEDTVREVCNVNK